MARMNESKRWQHTEPYKAVLVIREARRADYIAITASDYAWTRPFDLHLFFGDRAEDELLSFMRDYGDEWCAVDFPWVVANVDFIDHCTSY